MKRSLFTGLTFFPFPVRGTSVHISLTLKQNKSVNLVKKNLLFFRKQELTFPKPYCNDDQKPSHDPIISYYFGN